GDTRSVEHRLVVRKDPAVNEVGQGVQLAVVPAGGEQVVVDGLALAEGVRDRTQHTLVAERFHPACTDHHQVGDHPAGHRGGELLVQSVPGRVVHREARAIEVVQDVALERFGARGAGELRGEHAQRIAAATATATAAAAPATSSSEHDGG